MANTLTLRTYLDELNQMLESESATKVVSHCRYILQHYPQNVDTYRLLGKALLQRGQHEGLKEHFDEAVEVFQRVLTVLPNDYEAHICLSEIRAEENALDRAIWHLERAYEQMSGNVELQNALRNLYAQRYGEQGSHKIQLTRGALARQYANGQLYDQALIELRKALEQSPKRIDLQLLLAETLWESHHPVEAGEMAVQVLRKLPNCLAANRIMARLFLDYERPSDAQKYLDRIEAVDPYEALQIVQPGVEPTPDMYLLERLDYSAKVVGALSTQTPDWVEELGDLDSFGTMEDAFIQPAPTPVPPTQPERGPDRIDAEAVFGSQPTGTPEQVPDWFSNLGLPTAVPSAPQPTEMPAASSEPDSAAGIPDWFNEFVQSEEAPVVIEAADKPVEMDWMLDAEEAVPSFEELTKPEVSQDAPMDMGWMLNEAAEAAPSFEELTKPELSQDAPMDMGWTAADAFEELPSPETSQEAPVEMDWLFASDLPTPEQPVSGGFTDLLGEIESARSSFDIGAGLGSEAEPIPPDWIRAFEDERVSDIVEDAVEEDPMAWMKTLNISPEIEGQDAGSSISSQELDALRRASMPPSALDLEAFFAEEEIAQDYPAGIPAEPNWDTASDSQESSPEEEVSDDWLAEMEAFDESGFLSALGETATPPAEVAPTSEAGGDWLTEMEPLDESGFLSALGETATPPAEATPTSEVGGDWLTEMEAFDESGFLSALEETATPPAEATLTREAGGDWLTEMEPLDESGFLSALEETATPPAEATPTSEAGGDWLAEMEPPDESGFLSALGETATPLAEATPTNEAGDDWLAEMEPLDESGFLSALEETATPPAEVAPTSEAGGDWLTEMEPLDESGFLSALEKTATPPAEATPTSEAGGDWLAEMEQPRGADVLDWLQTPNRPVVEAGELESPEDTLVLKPDTDDRLEWFQAESDPEIEIEQTGAGDMPYNEAAAEVQADTPAWLSEMAPVENDVPDNALDKILEEPYDPFGTAKPDLSYQTSGTTGILQPTEEPDWMFAFSGEEVPLDVEEQLDEALGVGESEELHLEELDFFAPKPVTDSLQDIELHDWGAEEPAEEIPSEEDVLPSSESEEGGMPEWLLAITGPEAAKLDEGLFVVEEEPEKYPSAADTGVLQPGVTPDWLSGVGDDIVEEELELFDQFEAERTQFESLAEETEVAQAQILAHTSEAEWIDSDDMEEMPQDEGVPDDFSFGELSPAWLRSAKEDEQAGWTETETPPQSPNWLRDLFEDDELNS